MKMVLVIYSAFLSFIHLTGQSTSSDFYDRYSAAVESGQYQSGIAITEEWKDQFQSEVKAYYYAAVACAKTGRRTEAIQNLEKALLLDSTHVPSLISLAELSKRSGDRGSLLLYEKLISINPANAYFYREAAESAVQVWKLDKAMAYYSLAYQNDSLDIITVTGFAKLLLDLRQYDDADSLLNRALELDPSNQFSRLTKAKLAIDSENWEGVLEWMEPLMIDNPPLLAMRYSGISLYHMGRYEDAIDVLRALSNAANELDYPHYYMGLCMEKLGQIKMARVQYGQALNKALSGNLGTYYERVGLMQQANGEHREAIETFRMAKHFSTKNILNFHLAKSYDVYYQDSKAALEMFETFITQEDTVQSPERTYAENRVAQLKKDRHFEGQ